MYRIKAKIVDPIRKLKVGDLSMLSGHLIVVFCFLVSFLTVKAQECSADGKLCDKHERCPVWKEEGECLRNDVYMKEECPASCAGTIKKTNKCEDLHPRCEVWAGLGECSKVDDVARFCPKACNQCTEDASCEDKHEKCAEWAKLGECTKNAKYMKGACSQRQQNKLYVLRFTICLISSRSLHLVATVLQSTVPSPAIPAVTRTRSVVLALLTLMSAFLKLRLPTV